MSNSRSHLEIKCNLEELAEVRKFVENSCQYFNNQISKKEIDEVKLAVHEAIVNIIQHAHKGGSQDTIAIEFSVEKEFLSVCLCYRGEKFNPKTVKKPVFDGTKQNGFGVYIIDQCMDEVHYTHENGKNCIQLRKNLKARFSMQIKVNDFENDICVIEIISENLDAKNIQDFKEKVLEILEDKLFVIFDMSHLCFVDSSGLGAILSCLRQLQSQGGNLKLSGMSRPVQALFELVRMHRIFDIFPNNEQARASYV